MADFVAAVDQGPTSTRCMVFDHESREVASYRLEHRQIRPRTGWVEHDPTEIWERASAAIQIAMNRAGLFAGDLAALGIANQRGTTVVWNRRTGRPYGNAIAWQDTRTDGLVGAPGDDLRGDLIRRRTGLPPATYACGGTLRWMLAADPRLRGDAERGEALFGTTESWLLWKLTGGPRGGVHLTDVTNASRTMLMDLETLDWHDELLDLFGVPRAMLPEIRPSSDAYGRTRRGGPLDGEVPLSGAVADQQAAMLGQVCLAPGEARATLGTGGCLLLNTGEALVRSGHGLTTTVGYRLAGLPPVYALEGPVALSGRPALPSAWSRSRDVADAMARDWGLALSVLKVDGALGADEACLQLQADLLGIDVVRPAVARTTALGAAYAAGLGVGFWRDQEEVRAGWPEDRRWSPGRSAERLLADLSAAGSPAATSAR